MRNVVAFEKTKRKLNWEQEEALRSNKRQDRQRRDIQRTNREAKWSDDSE